ncbi:phage virion morphogenesis protein [Conservatibacter flavescens]|uniref:Phage virion morphogenesis protein n=1 Tax=Conservatibacter flavescens TaxID=28161 RepID=A0A2M8S4Z6_9PAST|nr:phage virion morphogenesis protein [Conservatibacter flavescens]PJG86209.1 phage virion morphogenesis protein [Conservatibacter flavescens]
MIEIKIENTDEVAKVLQAVAEKAKHRTDLMRKLAGRMEYAVKTNFHEGGRPKWLGLKYRSGKPLVDSEVLSESISSEYDNDNAIVGTNEPYAAIHQFGGMAGRGKKVKIPARPFLKLTPDDEEDLLEDVQDYFSSLIK